MFELHRLILPRCPGDWYRCPGQGLGEEGRPHVRGTHCVPDVWLCQSWGVGNIVIPMFQMRTIRLREIQGLAPGRPVQNPGAV